VVHRSTLTKGFSAQSPDTAARRSFIPVPFALWHVLATVSEYVPGAPLTRDQIALMQNDNVASSQLPGLRELGVEPTPVDSVLDEVGRSWP
jgi:NADH dehydrogenase